MAVFGSILYIFTMHNRWIQFRSSGYCYWQ
ncbi:hypothetical protein NXX38_17000 [Bacteroides sp. BFG-637]|nr:hypothetical protein [Bacteroides sp. BFG-637]MCS3313498.1 hypothetical protein [Bacteroides sp. BFG-637]